ncbi:MAG TPA: hypothetical protein VGQ41_22745 [Pyrinomonadaceae bacterium]|jgi:hypothetical protein|nr:hypothetical protein [Pyrinomonadaceae bacterium]
MSSEVRNATTSGYRFSGESRNEPSHPMDPPDNTGGGLPGDPVKSDYVYPPEPIDPLEPEPPDPTPPQG